MSEAANVHDAAVKFSDTFLNDLRTAIPTKKIRVADRQPPWFDNRLKRLIRQRDAIFKAGGANTKEFKKAKKKVKNAVCEAKQSYYVQQFSECQKSAKYWKLYGEISGSSQKQYVPALRGNRNYLAESAVEKAELLADQYDSVWNQSSLPIYSIGCDSASAEDFYQ